VKTAVTKICCDNANSITKKLAGSEDLMLQNNRDYIAICWLRADSYFKKAPNHKLVD